MAAIIGNNSVSVAGWQYQFNGGLNLYKRITPKSVMSYLGNKLGTYRDFHTFAVDLYIHGCKKNVDPKNKKNVKNV